MYCDLDIYSVHLSFGNSFTGPGHVFTTNPRKEEVQKKALRPVSGHVRLPSIITCVIIGLVSSPGTLFLRT